MKQQKATNKPFVILGLVLALSVSSSAFAAAGEGGGDHATGVHGEGGGDHPTKLHGEGGGDRPSWIDLDDSIRLPKSVVRQLVHMIQILLDSPVNNKADISHSIADNKPQPSSGSIAVPGNDIGDGGGDGTKILPEDPQSQKALQPHDGSAGGAQISSIQQSDA